MSAFDPKRTSGLPIGVTTNQTRLAEAVPPPRTLEDSRFRSIKWSRCQKSFHLSQWPKHKAVGAGVSEEVKGTDAPVSEGSP